MKKPYSSTFIWQLGSNMYGSCRDKEGGASLKIHLTWRNFKQPTHVTHNWLSQQHTHHTNLFSRMYLVTGTQMHNMTKIYEKFICYVHVLPMFCTADTVSWEEQDECQLARTAKISDLNTLMCTEGERQQWIQSVCVCKLVTGSLFVFNLSLIRSQINLTHVFYNDSLLQIMAEQGRPCHIKPPLKTNARSSSSI